MLEAIYNTLPLRATDSWDVIVYSPTFPMLLRRIVEVAVSNSDGIPRLDYRIVHASGKVCIPVRTNGTTNPDIKFHVGWFNARRR